MNANMFVGDPGQRERVAALVGERFAGIKAVAESDSRHTTLLDVHPEVLGNNLVLTFFYHTGDAQGQNMMCHATRLACEYIKERTSCPYYLRSHYSGVKHQSPRNIRLGYGRRVAARGLITASALRRLGVDAIRMKDFFDRCIECGRAAGIAHVNVHAANPIAALFVACGQDVADVVSSAVCSTRVELAGGGDLEIHSEPFRAHGSRTPRGRTSN